MRRIYWFPKPRFSRSRILLQRARACNSAITFRNIKASRLIETTSAVTIRQIKDTRKETRILPKFFLYRNVKAPVSRSMDSPSLIRESIDEDKINLVGDIAISSETIMIHLTNCTILF